MIYCFFPKPSRQNYTAFNVMDPSEFPFTFVNRNKLTVTNFPSKNLFLSFAAHKHAVMSTFDSSPRQFRSLFMCVILVCRQWKIEVNEIKSLSTTAFAYGRCHNNKNRHEYEWNCMRYDAWRQLACVTCMLLSNFLRHRTYSGRLMRTSANDVEESE